LIQEMKAESLHEALLRVLRARFWLIPVGVSKQVRSITKEKQLLLCSIKAVRAPDSGSLPVA